MSNSDVLRDLDKYLKGALSELSLDNLAEGASSFGQATWAAIQANNDKPTPATAEEIEKLQPDPSRINVLLLLYFAAGAAAKGEESVALKCYRAAVTSPHDRLLLTELGFLMLEAAGAHYLPYCVLDLSRDTWDQDQGRVMAHEYYLLESDALRTSLRDSVGDRQLLLRFAGYAFAQALDLQAGAGFLASGVASVANWLALDGLRCVLSELGSVNLGRLMEAFDEFHEFWSYLWGEGLQDNPDYPPSVFPAVPVIEHFAELRGSLRATGGAMAPTGAEVELRLRQIFQSVRQLHQRGWNAGGDPDVVAQRVVALLATQLNQAPDPVVEAAGASLKEEFRESGRNYQGLDWRVQRLLCQAVWQETVCSKTIDADWFPVVGQYGRAIETLLRAAASRLRLGNQPIPRSNLKGSWERDAGLGNFVWLFRNHPQTLGLTVAQAGSIATSLDEFRGLRNEITHKDRQVGAAEAREVRRLVLGKEAGLVWMLQSLGRLNTSG